MFRKLTLGAAAVSASLVTAACGGAGTGATNGTISYWLWDSAQQPGYQKCADEFQKQGGLEDLAQVARQAQELLQIPGK